MTITVLPLLFLLFGSPAHAQSKEGLIQALENQRNIALTLGAQAEAKVVDLAAEVERLKKEIEGLKQNGGK